MLLAPRIEDATHDESEHIIRMRITAPRQLILYQTQESDTTWRVKKDVITGDNSLSRGFLGDEHRTAPSQL